MSALAYTQFDFSLIRKKVTLYAVVDIGASGACTLKQWNPPTAGAAGSYSSAGTSQASPYSPTGTQGIASVTKESTAGQYTFVFQGSFARLLKADFTPLVATTGVSAACKLGVIGTAPSVTSNPGQVTVQLVDYAGNAVNPASGERIIFEFVLDDSSTI